MEFTDFAAGKDDIDRRLDKVIRIFLNEKKLSELYKLIRKGLIKVNKKKTTPEYKLQENDVISIASFLIPDFNAEISKNDDEKKDIKKNINLPPVVFENENILIINKPYNINVHGDDESLEKIIINYYESSKDKKDSLSFIPGPLHRLDKKTTGLLAFSKSLEGARWFTKNIENHQICKKYYALLEGKIIKKEEWIDEIEVTNSFKQAVTIVTPIETGSYKGVPVTFAKIEIKTGRKHQIRIQSSLHGHPLCGDSKYNCKLSFNKNEKREFYLQAYELNIPKDNPIGLPDLLRIDLDKDFLEILKHCEIKKTGV